MLVEFFSYSPPHYTHISTYLFYLYKYNNYYCPEILKNSLMLLAKETQGSINKNTKNNFHLQIPTLIIFLALFLAIEKNDKSSILLFPK